MYIRESNDNFNRGYISSIVGSLIEIKGLQDHVRLYDLIKISKHNILGEVIQIYSDHVIAQCFENTIKVKLKEEVISLHEPLSMELGPGLISHIFDGIQRPLEQLFKNNDSGRLERGIKFPPLSRTKKWHFKPLRIVNDEINSGDIIGVVQETKFLEHKIMVPPYLSGKLSFISSEGEYTILDEIYRMKINGKEKAFSMMQKWPITVNRPYRKRLDPTEPLITGMRVIDLLFPAAKGGTIAIPGGFGTGKTVIQQSLAKWSDVDVVVFIGCGEPGNEIANVLKQFSEVKDPQTGQLLLEHIILIANTSNMPVSAREASLFSGITIAEYYRDMGYDVALMADSTSRLAEAMREISGRLEEMPGEEGYPAYLASRLAEFYERAGRVRLLGSKNKEGSVSVMGAVSPPGGDFSEPVAQNTLRIVKVFWALDSDLADRRHFPSINWLKSYSLYLDEISSWWNKDVGKNWLQLRNKAMALLQKESELQEIVKLVGPDALPPKERALLEGARMIREDFLQQSAFHNIDTYCPGKKQYEMLRIMSKFSDLIQKAIEKNVHIDDIISIKSRESIARMGTVPNKDFDKRFEKLEHDLEKEIESLIKEVQ